MTSLLLLLIATLILCKTLIVSILAMVHLNIFYQFFKKVFVRPKSILWGHWPWFSNDCPGGGSIIACALFPLDPKLFFGFGLVVY